MSFPYQVYAAAWRDVHRQWRSLLPYIRDQDDRASITTGDMEQRTAMWEDWRNLTLYLAATLSCCLNRNNTASSFPRRHLPLRLQVDQPLRETVDHFLDQLVVWLVADSAFQRETALEAVCFELNPSFYPDLLFKLDGFVNQYINFLLETQTR